MEKYLSKDGILDACDICIHVENEHFILGKEFFKDDYKVPVDQVRKILYSKYTSWSDKMNKVVLERGINKVLIKDGGEYAIMYNPYTELEYKGINREYIELSFILPRGCIDDEEFMVLCTTLNFDIKLTTEWLENVMWDSDEMFIYYKWDDEESMLIIDYYRHPTDQLDTAEISLRLDMDSFLNTKEILLDWQRKIWFEYANCPIQIILSDNLLKKIFTSSYTGEKYIDMKEYSNNWYFYDKDISISDHDIEKVKPFNHKYCSCLWNYYISKSGSHPMLLESDEWPAKLLKNRPIYYFNDDWNDNRYDTLKELLREYVDFNNQDFIYFFWSRENGVETTWEIFLRYWINFLFDDEGPILINPNSKYVIRFWPDGSVRIGERIDL